PLTETGGTGSSACTAPATNTSEAITEEAILLNFISIPLKCKKPFPRKSGIKKTFNCVIESVFWKRQSSVWVKSKTGQNTAIEPGHILIYLRKRPIKAQG